STLWESVRNEIRAVVSQNDFDSWFSNISATEISGDVLVLEAPSVLAEAWVNNNFGDLLRHQVTLAAGRTMSYRLIAPTVSREVSDTPAPAPTRSRASTATKPPAIKANNNFDNFIVGTENEMAHGASLAVAKEPGYNYNPLFIYGPTGLGKTHLMHAIAHSLFARNPSARIAYVTSETFTNEFIQGLQTNSVAQFRRRYRELDLLLIDDIQFLAGK
ncbi:MAG TPA: chromosomal replication initiator protein DnaA, partial [Opitutae bacterium]|nr:chromosomal replication initiator protein DnaA [Opitutae bacterium]